MVHKACVPLSMLGVPQGRTLAEWSSRASMTAENDAAVLSADIVELTALTIWRAFKLLSFERLFIITDGRKAKRL